MEWVFIRCLRGRILGPIAWKREHGFAEVVKALALERLFSNSVLENKHGYHNVLTMLGFLKDRQRRRLKARPFPNEWLKVIKARVAFFLRLAAVDQAELLEHIQVFLADKNFEGCAGQAITDEVRVTIAAQACLLLLHRKAD